MGFKFREYNNLLFNGDIEGSEKYRVENIPKKLYKYVSLSDGKCNRQRDLDKRKLEDLESRRLWLSTYKNLNDPFELKGMYVNREKLKESDWKEYVGILDSMLEQIKEYYLIGSLTTHINDNLPMWAHYTNNHRGICIEYEIKNASYIYKVSYELNRVPIAGTITQLVSNMYKDYIAGNEIISKESEKYRMIIFNQAIMKDETWRYEDEYRILYYNYKKKDFGDKVNLDKLGIKISKVFIGINCEDYNIKRLKEICRVLKCELFQMYFDEESEGFSLKYKHIEIN